MNKRNENCVCIIRQAAFIKFQTHDCRLPMCCCAKQSGGRRWFLATDAASDATLPSDKPFNSFSLRCLIISSLAWYISGLKVPLSKEFCVLCHRYLATESASDALSPQTSLSSIPRLVCEMAENDTLSLRWEKPHLQTSRMQSHRAWQINSRVSYCESCLGELKERVTVTSGNSKTFWGSASADSKPS